MKYMWLWLCLLLFVFQVITSRFVRERGVDPQHETGLSLLDWDELAWATLKTWETIWPEAGEPLSADPRAGTLYAREAILLELADLEAQMNRMGIDAHLVEAARNWMKMVREDSDTEDFAEVFLRGLLSWGEIYLDAFALEGGRLQLLPGKNADFPDLQFEMEGDLERVGRFLAETALAFPCWELENLELREFASASSWWTCGLYSYQEVRRP